jgi:asparagine synthase (glutamine-hydrolysing)
VESWISNELKDFVRDVLLDRKTLERGYFQKTFVEDLIADGPQREKHASDIFSLLTLELWHRQFLDQRN